MLVDGKWTRAWQPVQATDAKGGFVRQASTFRGWVTPDGAAGPTGEAGFRAEKDRYHLYAALTCPWATRVLIARKLKRLEGVVSLSIVEPAMTGIGESLTIVFSASTSFSRGTAQRTMSAPASATRRIWAIVAVRSAVSVLVIVCTATGAPPPIGTPPTNIWRFDAMRTL